MDKNKDQKPSSMATHQILDIAERDTLGWVLLGGAWEDFIKSVI